MSKQQFFCPGCGAVIALPDNMKLLRGKFRHTCRGCGMCLDFDAVSVDEVKRRLPQLLQMIKQSLDKCEVNHDRA